MIRHIDYTGVSGIGVVAYGVTFADGQVVLRWCSAHPATSMWNSIEDMLAVHGHGDATSVEWIDAPYGDLEDLTSHAAGVRGRRRADKASDGAREQAPAPSPEPSAAPPATPQPEPLPTAPPEPLPRRRPSGPPTGAGPAERADRPAGRVILDETGGGGTTAASGIPAADDSAARRGERPNAEPAHAEPDPATRLFGTDERNGHLSIDTSPLLFTYREREEEPAPERPRRRGGRHRRIDPDTTD